MFADSLLDSAYGNRSHHGWATEEQRSCRDPAQTKRPYDGRL